MTFDEFINSGDYAPFHDYMTMEEAMKTGKVSAKYHKVFPTKCECGSDIIIKKSLTSFRCCNPRCLIKLSYSLELMFKAYGVKGIGQKSCYTFLKAVESKLKLPSHVEVLNIPYDEYPLHISQVLASEIFQACYKIRTEPVSFGEMIARLGLPRYGPSSKDLFEGIKGIEEFINECRTVGSMSNYFAHRGVHDNKKLFYFRFFIHDIVLMQNSMLGGLKLPALSTVSVCMSGFMVVGGVDVKKAGFINMCNEICTVRGKRVYEFDSVQTPSKASYVITTGQRATRKLEASRELERRNGVKIIYTPDEFIAFLKLKIKDIESRLNKMEV